MADSVQWTASAEALLKEIPFFVRPAARKKIEKYARENGVNEITDAVYEKAKAQFGRKK
ncbi:MAG: protochlorophyllide oxidoreductase [Phormidesmis sp.]